MVNFKGTKSDSMHFKIMFYNLHYNLSLVILDLQLTTYTLCFCVVLQEFPCSRFVSIRFKAIFATTTVIIIL